MENPKTFYKTHEALEADEAITRGWVPEFLPKSAVNITEQHDLDTNTGFITFEAPRQDIDALIEHCNPVHYDGVKYLSSYRNWWPQELTSSNNVSMSLSYYLCEDYGILTTFNPNRAYYWYAAIGSRA